MIMVVRVLAYTCNKWIIDLDSIKVQSELNVFVHENIWLHKVNWNPLQWTWHDPNEGQGSKVIAFFQFMSTLDCHILSTQNDKESATTKIWHTLYSLYNY